MKQQSSPRVPASARQSAPARQAAAGQRPVRTGCACSAANQPQVRRYTHPIERSAQRAPRCEALQTVLCALAGQNQVLCAIKAELDEVLALLEQQKTEPADRGGGSP